MEKNKLSGVESFDSSHGAYPISDADDIVSAGAQKDEANTMKTTCIPKYPQLSPYEEAIWVLNRVAHETAIRTTKAPSPIDERRLEEFQKSSRFLELGSDPRDEDRFKDFMNQKERGAWI
jgi:hypothetical protein